MKGLIFSVKRYSIHDGPGIRVTFFMKGCPLSCAWCHNPEGISPIPEVRSFTNRVGSLEFSKEGEVGKYYSVSEVINAADKERVFMSQSNGGVTFSGGEPFVQKDFLIEALKALKSNGYHTAVDTSGFSHLNNFKEAIPYTDLFLYDLKHLDNAKHISLTGVPNEIILDNYLYLLQNAKEVNPRIPVIPGFNDSPDHMKAMRDFISTTKTGALKKINLLPFHKIGMSKYKRFNMPYQMEDVDPPTKEKMLLLKELFLETGVKVKIGG
jgi:pyruvate formate lyase activating enzyme